LLHLSKHGDGGIIWSWLSFDGWWIAVTTHKLMTLLVGSLSQSLIGDHIARGNSGKDLPMISKAAPVHPGNSSLVHVKGTVVEVFRG
jgi:hypothetical protein